MRRPDLDRLAPLAEPVRRRLYELVVAAPDAVDRDAAAAGAGVGRPLAAFHLDRLVEAGLLEVEFRRRSGRTGPGAGRPAKFYRPARTEISVSVPRREYRLAAEILAEGVERAGIEHTGGAVMAAARERGAELAREAGPAVSPARLVELLAGQGYEPVVQPDGMVRLRNCPFDALVTDHRELTCSMNLSLLTSLVEASGATGMRPVAAPADGYCCVAMVAEG